jgi:hypothetical protein
MRLHLPGRAMVNAIEDGVAKVFDAADCSELAVQHRLRLRCATASPLEGIWDFSIFVFRCEQYKIV